ncbi:MAG: hypothetical protein U1F83_01075 [Verrucomicrobiota bacterium]
MKKAITVLVAISFLEFASANGQEMKQETTKATILLIEKEVRDLTTVSDLLRSTNFQHLRKSVSKELGKEIVALIRERQLSVGQSQIALHILSGLSDEHYWDVTEPLLKAEVDERILSDVLLQSLPFGPCYANANKSTKYYKILDALGRDKSLSENTKAKLSLILDGRAAEIYRAFLKDPRKYGHSESTRN